MGGVLGRLGVTPAAEASVDGVPGHLTAEPATEAKGDDAEPGTEAGANGAVPWRLAVEPATDTKGGAMP